MVTAVLTAQGTSMRSSNNPGVDDACSHCKLKRCVLHNSGICANLDDDERTRLNAIAHVRHIAKGTTIIAQGEVPAIVGNVVEGILKMQRTDVEGREQIVGLLVPTDMFGRVFSGASEFSVEAATDVVLCCYDKPRFEAMLMEHPRLEHQVMLWILDELDAAREWISLLSGQSVAQRFASFLLILCRRWPSLGCGLSPDGTHVQVTVPIGRADLAHFLGTTVETISRTVRTLSDAGIIESVTPASFRVLDLHALIKTSGNTDFDPGDIIQTLRKAEAVR